MWGGSSKAMNMSYYTDSTLLQTMMENPLEKKAVFFFAGSGYGDLGKGMNQVEREHVQPFLMQRIVKIIHIYPAK